MDSFDELRKMTENLPILARLDDFVVFSNDGYVEFGVEGGRMFGTVLVSRDSVTVMKIFIAKGTTIPQHNNFEGKETLVVFRGKLKVYYPNKEIDTILEPGDSITFEKELERGGLALEDTWLIFTAVPRVSDFLKQPKDG
jgi:quercetin dioxygenase-like cupin family protein